MDASGLALACGFEEEGGYDTHSGRTHRRNLGILRFTRSAASLFKSSADMATGSAPRTVRNGLPPVLWRWKDCDLRGHSRRSRSNHDTPHQYFIQSPCV